MGGLKRIVEHSTRYVFRSCSRILNNLFHLELSSDLEANEIRDISGTFGVYEKSLLQIINNACDILSTENVIQQLNRDIEIVYRIRNLSISIMLYWGSTICLLKNSNLIVDEVKISLLNDMLGRVTDSLYSIDLDCELLKAIEFDSVEDTCLVADTVKDIRYFSQGVNKYLVKKLQDSISYIEEAMVNSRGSSGYMMDVYVKGQIDRNIVI